MKIKQEILHSDVDEGYEIFYLDSAAVDTINYKYLPSIFNYNLKMMTKAAYPFKFYSIFRLFFVDIIKWLLEIIIN